jgi:DNA-directed RNA polymerase subunit A'
MKVQEHILSPRYGGPIIGAIHDHITGAYLLTHRDTVFEEDKALQIIKRAKMALPEAKGEPWTGKEVFSLLLPDKLNLVYKAEICRK